MVNNMDEEINKIINDNSLNYVDNLILNNHEISILELNKILKYIPQSTLPVDASLINSSNKSILFITIFIVIPF